jgi:hypothetical protein
MMFRLIAFLIPALLAAGDWSPPVEVRNDDQLCVTYRARWDGEHLAVQAKLEPGWHTFAMDNKERQDVRLAGKPSLGAEKPTTVHVSGGLVVEGPWVQTEPKDFSKPELRWFSWGFDDEALFVAKARNSNANPVELTIKGQACSGSICKNVTVTVPLDRAAGGEKISSNGLVPLVTGR